MVEVACLAARCAASGDDDDVRVAANQVCCETWEPLKIAVGEPVLVTDVFAVRISELSHAAAEAFQIAAVCCL